MSFLPTNITRCIGPICFTIFENSPGDEDVTVKKTLHFRLAPPLDWIVAFWLVLLIVTALKRYRGSICGLGRGVRAWFAEENNDVDDAIDEWRAIDEGKPSGNALLSTTEEPSKTVGDAAEPANGIPPKLSPTTDDISIPESLTDEGTSAIGGDADVPAHEIISKLSRPKSDDTTPRATDGKDTSATGNKPAKNTGPRGRLVFSSTKARTGTTENAVGKNSATVVNDMPGNTGLVSLSPEPSPTELVFARHAPDVGPTKYVQLQESTGDAPVQGLNGDTAVQVSEKPP
ncbi:MAG: hypothetical protein Q9166_007817 [cf. Caloplaca sp. 2 TL-2023]